MPAIGSTFKTDAPQLNVILDQIHKGQIQLPDFQRGWVWDDEHIRALIVSVSQSYPIGAVMLLEMGGDGVRFKPRLVEGVPAETAAKPDQLILDGQQRLTSLYLALRCGKPVPTRTDKGQDIERYYYLDIGKCLDPEIDRLDAVIGVPADKIVRVDFAREVELDLSTRENEIRNGMLPLNLILDHVGFSQWRNDYQQYHGYERDKIQIITKFEQEIWIKFQQYKIPIIELLKGTEKEAVCQVFEKVNTGGVTLSVFELVTATFAADDFHLRSDWYGDAPAGLIGRQERLHGDAYKPLKGSNAVDFLTAATLLSTFYKNRNAGSDPKPAVSCKKKDVLKLTLEEYKLYANDLEEGFKKAARLLIREKVFDLDSLPYTTQLIPLAAICAFLGDRFEQDNVKEKLARWYWSGVFGELYGAANETRYAQDLPDVINWINGGELPRTIVDSSFSPIRLLTLQTRNSAAYKGMFVRLLQKGSRDFLSGDPIELITYFDLAVDIHHIFPKAWAENHNIPRPRWNSIVNKAALTSRTNRIIGGRAPSAYVKGLETGKGVTAERLNEILASHVIEPTLLCSDDFDGFFRARAAALLDLIEEATGKPVTGRDSEEVVEAFGGPLTRDRAQG